MAHKNGEAAKNAHKNAEVKKTARLPRTRGGSLVLVAPQRLVARVLGAMGTGQMLTVYRTVDEAVAGS